MASVATVLNIVAFFGVITNSLFQSAGFFCEAFPIKFNHVFPPVV